MALRSYFHLCRQGLAADRPANPSGDWHYFATDTLVLSIYDSGAAAWRDFPAIFTLPLSIANGGTGQTTAQAAFNALSPSAAKGDQIVNDGTNDVAVAVGSNGQEWIPDSSDAEGIVWRTTIVRKTSDETTFSTTAVDVTDLTIPVAANRKYKFRINLMYDNTIATEGPRFSINGPASPTSLRYVTRVDTSNTASRVDSFTAYDNAFSFSSGTVSIVEAVIEGVLENGANAGNLTARFWTETGNAGTDGTTVRSNSSMRVQEIP